MACSGRSQSDASWMLMAELCWQNISLSSKFNNICLVSLNLFYDEFDGALFDQQGSLNNFLFGCDSLGEKKPTLLTNRSAKKCPLSEVMRSFKVY